jgi:hypothetical protein
MATIDKNGRNVGLGYVQGTNNMVLPFAINPATNALLVEVIPIGSPLATFNGLNRLKIDGNTRNVAGGVTDDSDQTITPLTVDLIAGLPCLRVEII